MIQTYKAENIVVMKDLEAVRDKYDLNWLASQIRSKGDFKRLAESLRIDRSVLSRAVDEANILSIFPSIQKSKANPLSRLKTRKELIIFTKKFDIHKLQVREIYKSIKNFRKDLENNPRILLNDSQHDLVIGSTMGDAYIRQRNKNCNFRVAHSKKQEDYVYWKYNILKEFTNSPPSWNIRILKNRKKEMLELSTFTHSVFNHYRKLFYKNGVKKLGRECLDLLNPRSLAIWVCDDGSYCKKQHYIIFCTNSYSLEEHEIMKQYFEEVFGLSPTIGFRDNKYYYLRFKVKDTKKLISIIKPFIPKGMEYKVGE